MPRVVVGDRDQDVVAGIDREPAGLAAGVVEGMPGRPVEGQGAAVLERVAQRSGAREDAAGHSPARVDIDRIAMLVPSGRATSIPAPRCADGKTRRYRGTGGPSVGCAAVSGAGSAQGLGAGALGAVRGRA